MDSELPAIDDMWDYDDPEATESRFRALLADMDMPLSYALEVHTQIARTFSLRGQFAEAHEILDGVQRDMDGGDRVEVRYLLERGRTWHSAGKQEKAIPLFHRAFALADTLGEPFYAVDALHMVAIAVPANESLSWNLRAITYAKRAEDGRARDWLGSLYNNTAWSYFDQRDYEAALALFQHALTERRRQGKPAAVRIARWCVGRTLRALGRVDDALAIKRELEQDPDHDGFVEEEIAECLLARQQPASAAPYFARAYERLAAIPWVATDQARLERLKQLASTGT